MPSKASPSEKGAAVFMYKCLVYSDYQVIDFDAVAKDYKTTADKAREQFARIALAASQYDKPPGLPVSAVTSANQRIASTTQAVRPTPLSTPKKTVKFFEGDGDANDNSVRTAPALLTPPVTGGKNGRKRKVNDQSLSSPTTPSTIHNAVVISDDDDEPPVTKKVKPSHYEPTQCNYPTPCSSQQNFITISDDDVSPATEKMVDPSNSKHESPPCETEAHSHTKKEDSEMLSL